MGVLNSHIYRQAIGSLMFAAIVTRPDISYAVGEVSRFMDNPKPSHVSAVKRILRYLNGTAERGIQYSGPSTTLKGYSDSDFARDVDTRKSTTGYVFLVGGGVITWKSHRQKTVALSTTEAEFMAACEGAKEAVWLHQLLRDVGYAQESPPSLYIDNQSAIRLIKNSELHQRTKHIDVRLHFIRQLYESKKISIYYVCSEDQLGDVFTKPLTTQKFIKNVEMLGMKDLK
ncbi:secreted RxLR effector protein 161-like [Rhagoletis pomonella]|uniref:secreted RxLR effector protein 161-like n=1 Tax=Rhagoletis pomonella TaxID=28610 RepID=UPI001783A0F0|nr:secreted RxLR effector protein 161-like [Rhagoletis pomonella]